MGGDNIYSNCSYASQHLSSDIPALSNSFKENGFFSWNSLIYLITAILLVSNLVVMYLLQLRDRIIPKEQPSNVNFGISSVLTNYLLIYLLTYLL